MDEANNPVDNSGQPQTVHDLPTISGPRPAASVPTRERVAVTSAWEPAPLPAPHSSTLSLGVLRAVLLLGEREDLSVLGLESIVAWLRAPAV